MNWLAADCEAKPGSATPPLAIRNGLKLADPRPALSGEQILGSPNSRNATLVRVRQCFCLS